MRLVGELHSAGVRLATGTDTGTGYLVPGFALHDELALLVAAGLTPAEALRAATRDAARTLGLPAVGTVARGHAADLLVLDADPLHDIRNTRRIHGIVVDGRWIPPRERRLLLAAVEAAAAQTPPPEAGRACGAAAAADTPDAPGPRPPGGTGYRTSFQSCEPSVAALCKVSGAPAVAPVRYRPVFLTDWSL